MHIYIISALSFAKSSVELIIEDFLSKNIATFTAFHDDIRMKWSIQRSEICIPREGAVNPLLRIMRSDHETD